MKPIKISHSALRTYSNCGRRYKLHYIDRLRPVTTSGALIMGSAIDKALNDLIENRNLAQAIEIFDKNMSGGFVNDKYVSYKVSDIIVYAKKDYDSDLLLPEDFNEYNTLFKEELDSAHSRFQAKKEESGFNSFTKEEKEAYGLANWLCIRRKGHIMLKSYNEKIIPKIKQVLAIQKPINLKNDDGDEITGWLDLAVEWEDGKRYMLDNKTSSMEYDKNSASKSQQLIIYYHAEKETFKLDGVGFIVMMKHILKNKVKKCKDCGFDGSGGRHKTCNNEYFKKKGEAEYWERCNGEWIETIFPECRIEVILNQVNEAAEQLVIDAFDEGKEGIKAGNFAPNLEACGDPDTGFVCPYYSKCWHGKSEDLIQLEEKR